MRVNYQGLFLDEQSEQILHSKETTALQVIAKNMHITFQLSPKVYFPKEVMGLDYQILVRGYGNDGINAGFIVDLPDDLRQFYKGAKQVHISTSFSPVARAKDTGQLCFNEIEPFHLNARLGYFVGNDVFFETPNWF